MPYLSTSEQLRGSQTFKSWGVNTYVFESWTLNNLDLFKYSIRLVKKKVDYQYGQPKDYTRMGIAQFVATTCEEVYEIQLSKEVVNSNKIQKYNS